MTNYKYSGPRLTPDERKNRMTTKRNRIPEQPATVRAQNFEEVNTGYTAEMAIAEAQRCLLCANAPCVAGCPVGVRIPEMLERTAAGDFAGAAAILRQDNILPAITGRVCPQESQCEGVCTVCKVNGEAVGIGYVERFLGDFSQSHREQIKSSTGTNRKRVAVVGSGPAGLTVAADCARAGHEVHIFEAFHQPGGVLVYGIPEFRLPKRIVAAEVEALTAQGVIIHQNQVIGTLHTIDELRSALGFDAVFLGIGAGIPKFMGIEGEEWNGVYSANEYLTRVNLMRGYRFPEYDTPVFKGKRVAVIGGGNVAMDAVRTARRLGAAEATLIYRRSRSEMPARAEEIHHAEEEGVQFQYLCNPLRYHGENGWVKSIECIRMALGDANSSGRRSPQPLPGSEFQLKIDLAIVAVGTGANPLLPKSTPGLQLNRWGYVAVDKEFRTTKLGVFAGGDIARGAATVILAMGDGRRAAASINQFLTDYHWPEQLEAVAF